MGVSDRAKRQRALNTNITLQLVPSGKNVQVTLCLLLHFHPYIDEDIDQRGNAFLKTISISMAK